MAFCFRRLSGSNTRVGWKVHRLTKKQMCHRNETWHALNSTVPDANCIVSFHMNPHWISNLWLWNVVLEILRKRPGKLTKGSPVSPGHCSCTHVCDCNGCCAWLWRWTGWPLITLHIPDLAPFDYFLFPNMKKPTWLGSSIGPMMRSYLQLRTFSRIRMRASIPQESKHCNTDAWKKCVDRRGEKLCWKKKHLVKFDQCFIVSLWTFQPTLVLAPFGWTGLNGWTIALYDAHRVLISRGFLPLIVQSIDGLIKDVFYFHIVCSFFKARRSLINACVIDHNGQQ